MRCKPAAVSRRVRCDKEWLRTRLQEEVEDICAEFAADEERRQQERRDAEWHDVAVAQEGGREGMGLSAPSLAKLESSKRLFLRWAEQHADKVMIDPEEGATAAQMRTYTGHIFRARLRHSAIGKKGRSESNNNHVSAAAAMP